MKRRYFFGAAAGASMNSVCAQPAAHQVSVSGRYNVREHGAKGDGASDDTKAIQAVIDRCSETGGHVVFPPGEYRTGMIRLKSHVTIELRNQAVWRAIPDLSLYPKPANSIQPAFLFAEDEEDLHITGQGKIHGSGEAHEVFIPAPDRLHKGPRPFGVLLRRCRNVSLSGIRLENSAYWMLRPEQCDDVVIRDVKIHNHANFNNDGIDAVDCHRVIISDCILDCEDDAICPKSESARSVVDMTINNCIISSHATALKFGTASRGGFNRIAISNCIVKPSVVRKTPHPYQLVDGIDGIGLMSTEGGALTNVSFNNIVIDGVRTPIFVRLGNQTQGYFWRKPGEPVPSWGAGIVENVTLSNIQAVNAGVVACSISGYPGHYVKNVKLSNIDLAFKGSGTEADITAEVPENAGAYPTAMMFGVNLPAYGLFLRHVKDISINGLHLRPPAEEQRPELVADDVHGLHVTRFRTSHPRRAKPRWKASNSTGVDVNPQERMEGVRWP